MTSEMKMEEIQSVETIAELGWETHRAWEHILGEDPRQPWDALSDQRRQELCDSVRWILDHPASHIAAQHDSWRAVQAAYGRENPNMVSFDELPFAQQMKARLWRHIVHAVVG